MMEILKIPEERKAVLIGKDGSVKKEIEEKTKTKISIGETIKIKGDTLNLLKAKNIIKAIGRGFSPEKALELLKDDYELYIISLVQETPKSIKRILARVIGRKGSTKKKIEDYTETHISVYGKTISIIGKWDNVDKARRAIEMILEGKPHGYVYKSLISMTKGE